MQSCFYGAHGTYSIKITDPLKFYAEVVPKNAERLEMEDINDIAMKFLKFLNFH